MFALWYGTITYQQYKDVIWRKFTKKQPKETAVISPSRIPVADTTTYRPGSPKIPQTLPSTLRTHIAHSTPKNSNEIPNEPLFNNTLESITSLSPIPANETTQFTDSLEVLNQPSTPISINKSEPVNTKDSVRVAEGPKLEPPPKPPRSPSPHPLRTEAFEEIEYEDEEEEEEEEEEEKEESSDGEDDENTVIYSNQLNATDELR